MTYPQIPFDDETVGEIGHYGALSDEDEVRCMTGWIATENLASEPPGGVLVIVHKSEPEATPDPDRPYKVGDRVVDDEGTTGVLLSPFSIVAWNVLVDGVNCPVVWLEKHFTHADEPSQNRPITDAELAVIESARVWSSAGSDQSTWDIDRLRPGLCVCPYPTGESVESFASCLSGHRLLTRTAMASAPITAMWPKSQAKPAAFDVIPLSNRVQIRGTHYD